MGISKKRLLELQKENLLLLAKNYAFEFSNTWKSYTSGEVGSYYIQSIDVEKDGRDYHNAVDSMCELIKGTVGIRGFDIISGGETRDWDFSNPVAYALVKPHTKIYKQKKPLAAIMDGKRIIHVADLNNEGSSVKNDWVPIIRQNGGILSHVFFYVDRMEDGYQVVKELGLESRAVVPMDANAWQILLDNNIISEEIYEALNQRMEDKKSWGQNALRRYPDPLVEMLRDPVRRARGEKILLKGYPEIKDELLDIMRRDFGYEHEFQKKEEKK